MSSILVTGGAGFIGSHTVVELIEAGHTPIIVDNFCNSDRDLLKKLEELTKQPIIISEFDVRDTDKLTAMFKSNII